MEQKFIRIRWILHFVWNFRSFSFTNCNWIDFGQTSWFDATEILHIQLRYLLTERDKALLSKHEKSLTIRFSEWQNKIINTIHVCERKLFDTEIAWSSDLTGSTFFQQTKYHFSWYNSKQLNCKREQNLQTQCAFCVCHVVSVNGIEWGFEKLFDVYPSKTIANICQKYAQAARW